ncbi:hypothetical protein BU26DRAFT_276078 [Trematosphaeria pertusa]|uniref:Uncharacterized protein n=1 Tax=Trematosphaeria pertusa TaxID=390896 RepID=A0A6A6INM4_9PLEO|nr:uncharacterized protein BU26DRAFT_276078 [Trematosphaeria pertusa]KAF2251083.1 hypothetical protein BU26DRAFT_276078 [Trematosphaeria pertusa]
MNSEATLKVATYHRFPALLWLIQPTLPKYEAGVHQLRENIPNERLGQSFHPAPGMLIRQLESVLHGPEQIAFRAQFKIQSVPPPPHH